MLYRLCPDFKTKKFKVTRFSSTPNNCKQAGPGSTLFSHVNDMIFKPHWLMYTLRVLLAVSLHLIFSILTVYH